MWLGWKAFCGSLMTRSAARPAVVCLLVRRSADLDANHISVLDEPLMWGVIPPSYFLDPRTVRWSLGASDILFKNNLYRWFFRQGQTLEVHRGDGIFQASLDEALARLAEGRWVHLFPEGYVNLTRSTRMRRFKWGVARLVLEAPCAPHVVPIWLQGLDQVMPHPRAPPRWLPRPGADISVTFGEPVPVTRFVQAYELWRAAPEAPLMPLEVDAPPDHLYQGTPLRPEDAPGYAHIRSCLAAHLRAELARLGTQSRIALGLGAEEGTLAHRPPA